jgi:hypothetical protein
MRPKLDGKAAFQNGLNMYVYVMYKKCLGKFMHADTHVEWLRAEEENRAHHMQNTAMPKPVYSVLLMYSFVGRGDLSLVLSQQSRYHMTVSWPACQHSTIRFASSKCEVTSQKKFNHVLIIHSVCVLVCMHALIR